MKISVIIVTYNRKELLLKCVEAVVRQTLKPYKLYVIDNNSTDGTSELLKEKSVINDSGYYENVLIEYIKLPFNGGGSMGFYEGLRVASDETDSIGFWVMDDDGIPKDDCLYELSRYLNRYDYISPIVADINDCENMAFSELTVKDFIQSRSKDGDIIFGVANPFNGILFSRGFIRNVGFPNKEMFIWGDEINYDLRGRQLGMPPVAICKAMHFHPKNRAAFSRPFMFGLKKVVFVDNKMKMYCRCCNAIYNFKLGKRYLQIVKEFILYNWLFCFSFHSWSWVRLYNTAFVNGLLGRFGGHKKYM